MEKSPRVSRSERFREPNTGIETEAPIEDPGLEFGGTHLSFSRLEPRTEKFERREGESDEEFDKRAYRKDEDIFIAGMLAAETKGLDGMVEACQQESFKIKRTQRREFLNAVANMSIEEYGAKIDSLLTVFPEGSDQFKRGMDVAISLRRAAETQAEIDRENATAKEEAALIDENMVMRSHSEPKPRIGVRNSVEFNTPSAEELTRYEEPSKPEFHAPQVEAMGKILDLNMYRRQKQERRSHGFLGKVKEKVSSFIAKKRKFLESVETESFSKPVNEFVEEPVHEEGDIDRSAGYFKEPVAESYGAERPEDGYFKEPLPEDIAGKPRPDDGYFYLPEKRYSDRYSFIDELSEDASYDFNEPDDYAADMINDALRKNRKKGKTHKRRRAA